MVTRRTVALWVMGMFLLIPPALLAQNQEVPPPAAAEGTQPNETDATGADQVHESLGKLLAALGYEPEAGKLRSGAAIWRITVPQGDFAYPLSIRVSRPTGATLYVDARLVTVEDPDGVPADYWRRLLAKNSQLGQSTFFIYLESSKMVTLTTSMSGRNLDETTLKERLARVVNLVAENRSIWQLPGSASQPPADSVAGSVWRFTKTGGTVEFLEGGKARFNSGVEGKWRQEGSKLWFDYQGQVNYHVEIAGKDAKGTRQVANELVLQPTELVLDRTAKPAVPSEPKGLLDGVVAMSTVPAAVLDAREVAAPGAKWFFAFKEDGQAGRKDFYKLLGRTADDRLLQFFCSADGKDYIVRLAASLEDAPQAAVDALKAKAPGLEIKDVFETGHTVSSINSWRFSGPLEGKEAAFLVRPDGTKILQEY